MVETRYRREKSDFREVNSTIIQVNISLLYYLPRACIPAFVKVSPKELENKLKMFPGLATEKHC